MRLIDADAIDTRYSDPEVVETLEEAPEVNAVVIPKGATNGNVFISTYNPYKAFLHEYAVHVYMTEKDFVCAEYQMNFDRGWWDSPYKEK